MSCCLSKQGHVSEVGQDHSPSTALGQRSLQQAGREGRDGWATQLEHSMGAPKQPSAEEVKSISQSKQSVQPEARLSQPSLRELAALPSLQGTHCHIPQTCLLSPGQSSCDGTEQASLTKA